MPTPHDVARGDWPKLIAALANPKSQNLRQRKTGPQPPPSTSTIPLKPAERSKTYLINVPDSVSILSAREEVPSAHYVEVESRAPFSSSSSLTHSCRAVEVGVLDAGFSFIMYRGCCPYRAKK